MRGFVIAGTASGCGKTTVTLGLLSALRKKGLTVQPFKAGPDFIDSGLHRIAAGLTSRNLDLWMCGDAYVRDCFHRHGSKADIAVVEGVMGLYDGPLSTARLSHVLGIPVILVVDAYGMAESAGALIKGFRQWGSELPGHGIEIKGVIFNRVASSRHYERLTHGVGEVNLLGYVPRDVHFEIPHRHLGLMVAEEEPVSPTALDRLTEAVIACVDIDGLVTLSTSTGPHFPPPAGETPGGEHVLAPCRVAVASDRAFCFYYQDNIDLIREAGAEILRFSPLADGSLPTRIDAVYIGGGYPELYAGALSQNASMKRAIREWAASGGPLYAECGGLMYLSRSIRDFDNHVFEMAGVFPFEVAMGRERAHLGYREVLLREDCILGQAGQSVRGHEFRYSDIVEGRCSRPDKQVYAVTDGSGKSRAAEGYCYKNTLGSYIHVHFGSNRTVSRSFIDFIRKGRT
jgi:cobyrinic acid a,c-diamide synthase